MAGRSHFYIDGFNLYHSIDDLGESFLKWCNLWKLSEGIAHSRGEALVGVTFCTAYYPGDHGKRIRHEAYKKALEAVGVKCVWGHYVTEPASCKKCNVEWTKRTEKETDINVALELYDDAVRDVYDTAYLITADSDQAATARMLKKRYPNKALVSVAPPGRRHSKDILHHAKGSISLTRDQIERAHFGHAVMVDGVPPVLRPREYNPPEGWVPFERRPQK